jgi:hypothetical protein
LESLYGVDSANNGRNETSLIHSAPVELLLLLQ